MSNERKTRVGVILEGSGLEIDSRREKKGFGFVVDEDSERLAVSSSSSSFRIIVNVASYI